MDTVYFLFLKYTPILLKIFLQLKNTSGNKLEESSFSDHFSIKYNSVIDYCCSYGIKRSIIAPGDEHVYFKDIKNKISFKNKYYYFKPGEIENQIFSKLILPTEYRFNKFLCYSYMYIYGIEVYFKYILFKERIRRIFTHSKTLLHYFSIPRWRTIKYKELIKTVKDIKKIEPLWSDKYRKTEPLNFSAKNPTIVKTIDLVLRKGKISERTIFNLVSSEKLLFLHKYAEGFGEVYKEQDQIRIKLTNEIEKWTKSIAKNADKKLSSAKGKRQNLLNNWIRAPLNTIIEKKGFQKLFNKMEGVYVLPFSMIPEKYHNNEESFINEEIIIEAEKHLSNLSKKVGENLSIPKELRYIVLSNVIQVSDLKIFTHGRDLDISSPGLSKMLLASYFAKENSLVSNIYINDLIRNVEFLSRFNPSTKTYEYFKKNFDIFKTLLWMDYKIDIFKPVQLIELSDNQLQELSDKMHIHDNSLDIRFILNALRDSKNFYYRLNTELEKLKN